MVRFTPSGPNSSAENPDFSALKTPTAPSSQSSPGFEQKNTSQSSSKGGENENTFRDLRSKNRVPTVKFGDGSQVDENQLVIDVKTPGTKEAEGSGVVHFRKAGLKQSVPYTDAYGGKSFEKQVEGGTNLQKLFEGFNKTYYLFTDKDGQQKAVIFYQSSQVRGSE